LENIDIDINIDKDNLKNIDIDIDMAILENIDIDIDIDKGILQNIDIDKISYRLGFGISNTPMCMVYWKKWIFPPSFFLLPPTVLSIETSIQFGDIDIL